MLTASTKNSLAVITTLMYITNSGPIKWNKRSQRVCPVTSKFNYWAAVVNYAVMVGFEVFLAFRCYQILVPHSGQPVNLSLACHLLYTFSCYAIPVHLQTNTFLRWNEIPTFINSFIDFLRIFKDKYGPTEPNIKNGCERLCKTFICLAGLITLQNAILILRKPDRLFFLTSLLDGAGRYCAWKRWALILVHVHIWLSFWAQLLFYGLTQYIYAFPYLFIIRQMQRIPGGTHSGLTSDTLRTPRVFMSMYRSIQVQHSMFERCYQQVFFPGHKVTMAISVVFSIYGAVKLQGNRRVLMAFVAGTGVLYLSVLFRRMGKFYELSLVLLNSWRGQRSAILDRFLRSCCTVQVRIGSYYPVTRVTVMSLGGIILNTSINMLISF